MALIKNLFVDMGSTFLSPIFTAVDANGNVLDIQNTYYLVAQFQKSRIDKFKLSFETIVVNNTLGQYQLKLTSNETLFQLQELTGHVTVTNVGTIKTLITEINNTDISDKTIGMVIGFGYISGSYSNVPLTGGHGTGATADMTVTSNEIISITLNSGGTGYQVGDILGVDNIHLGGVGSGFSVPVSAVYNLSDIVGTGTLFTREVFVGDSLVVEISESTTNHVLTVVGEAQRKAVAVIDDTHLTLDSDVASPHTGVDIFKINNIVADRYYYDILAINDTDNIRIRLQEGLVVFNAGETTGL